MIMLLGSVAGTAACFLGIRFCGFLTFEGGGSLVGTMLNLIGMLFLSSSLVFAGYGKGQWLTDQQGHILNVNSDGCEEAM